MVNGAVALTGLALLCWPPGRSAGRLQRVLGRRNPGRLTMRRPGVLVVAATAAGLAWLPLGPGGAFAAGLGAATAWWRWRMLRLRRDRHAAHDGMAEALRALVLELRAGAHPAGAAESVAVDAHPQAAIAMRAISGATRLGGDVERALAGVTTTVPALAGALDQLVRAWRLVQRHGLPLADVLDAVRRELDGRVRFATQVHARMAGPRASSAVLALLPATGVLLGQAMGAAPLHVLRATPMGQVLLALGAALVCAGVMWTVRLTEQAVLS